MAKSEQTVITLLCYNTACSQVKNMSKKKKNKNFKKKNNQKKQVKKQTPVKKTESKKPVQKKQPEKKAPVQKNEVKKPAEVKQEPVILKPEKKPEKNKKEYVRKFSWKDSVIPTVLKYIFSIVLTFLSLISTGKQEFIWAGLLELGAIAFFSNMLVKKNRIAGQIVNDILIILYNIQFGFLYYAGTYVTTVMVENTDSIEALSGKFAEYGFMIALVALFTLLPIHPFTIRHTSDTGFLSFFLCGELAMTMTLSSVFSPLYNTADLYRQIKENEALRNSLIANVEYGEDLTAEFYRHGLENWTAKPAELPENPNIVLIITEGLSQNVIDDERDIMPNVREYQNTSYNFTNYFNNTFATYRGIISLLYSGFQLGNYDPNNLTSIQSILKDRGYYTSFVNAEPNNMHFTSYLGDMGFDKLVSNPTGTGKQYLEDSETYDLLFETIREQAKSDDPFFTAVYTFETHIGMHPESQKFGDGSSDCLNKFHNADHWFGEFMHRLYSSEMADNTIVIFTTDHASYSDADYLAAFKSKTNPEMDRIPFFIYYKNCEYHEFDAEGRNSTCLAPTLMDFLDIDVENYFLGFTLFARKEATNNNYDTVFFDGTSYYTSENSKVEKMKEEPMELIKAYLQRYFAAKLQVPPKREQTQ